MGNEIGAAVAVELGTNLYVSVHDQRGSVAVLLTPAGTVAESYRYDAYGNVKIYDQTGSEIANHQSAIGNLWQFSSKRMDKETGLYCFGRRCYDPTLGRFVTADPSGFADGPNLYAYCGGDPVNLIDPDGQLSKSYSSGSSISLPSNYGSSSWGFNQNSFAGVDQIKQDYHNYQMQNNATYYDQHTYAQSSVNYSPSTVLYASSSYSYAPSTFSYANPSTSSYQAFDKSRIAASQGNYLAAAGLAVHEGYGRFTGFDKINAATSGNDTYTAHTLSTGERWASGISGSAQLGMTAFSVGLGGYTAAPSVMRGVSAVSSRMTSVGNSVMNFKPMSLVDDFVLYYPNSPPARSTVGGLITSAHYNMNNTVPGQFYKGMLNNMIETGLPPNPSSVSEFVGWALLELLK